MSFAGYGPLGPFGWGTTTAQALEQQASAVQQKHRSTVDALQRLTDPQHAQGPAANGVGLSAFPPLQGARLTGQSNLLNLTVPSIATAAAEAEVFPAAVFTDQQAENLPFDKRQALFWRKREFSDQPKDVVETTQRFQEAALASLQRRHAAMQALPSAQKAVLLHAAEWLSALVIHVVVRELLLYPLIRDHVEGGGAYHQRALRQNDELRALLRTVRTAVYLNPADSTWYAKVADAQAQWLSSWERERQDWLPQLSEYLRHAQVSTLREICASHEHVDIPDPQPPTSHDLNYGQQLTQMWEILYANMTRTGNLQGIPRPRHEADWACPDGFDPANPLMYGPPDDERGTFPPSTGLGAQLPQQDPDPQTSTELPPRREAPPSTPSAYLPFGVSLTRQTKLPDAVSAEARKQVDATIASHANYSKAAHRRAAIKHYGSEQAEALATRKALIASAADKATSLNEYLMEQNHTTDLEGSYYYDEVTLAFRNHGQPTAHITLIYPFTYAPPHTPLRAHARLCPTPPLVIL